MVDDDSVVLMLLERVLKVGFPDCHIVEFLNAENALFHILQQQPDAVITDYNMGEMSGVELIQRLREAGLNIPIIMVSNHPLIRQKAVTAGATAFIDKIEIAERLVETVRHSSPSLASSESSSSTARNYFPQQTDASTDRTSSDI